MTKEQCLLYLYYIPNLIHTGAFKFLEMKCNNCEKQSIEEKSTNFDAENGILFQQLILRVFLRLSMKLISSILNISAIIGGNSVGYCNC